MQYTDRRHARRAVSVVIQGCRGMLLSLALLSAGAAAAAPDERPSADTAAEQASRIPLWPAGMAPGDTALPQPQRIMERSSDAAVPDRYIQSISAPYMVV